MTAKAMTSGLVLRWMSFKEYGDQITHLRRQVYTGEQGFGEDMTSSEHDEAGLHLGAFVEGELVSTISAFYYVPDDELCARYHLPAGPEPVVQFSKRADKMVYRSSRIGELIGAAIFRAVYETLRPRLAFFLLRGVHTRLKSYYLSTFDSAEHVEIDAFGGSVVVILPDEVCIKAGYFKMRKLCDAGAARLTVQIPSLVRFLDEQGHADWIAIDKLKQENLYMAPLSLTDELPRLSAQTRLLLIEQKSRIAAVDFPPPPARLLDAGAGPGVYLSRLAQESQFQGYELVGLDRSAEMVAYARLSRPDVRWINASIYDTGEPDHSYDVIHTNFLFIHLSNPALALREIHRLLKPGGILYVLDVNDSTFQAPPVLTHLIELHTELCEGNRSVLNVLPGIAAEHGFKLVRSFSTRAHNTASDHDLSFAGDELRLDPRTSWGIFSFIGQRDELAEHFKAAQEYYFSSKCEISICIQTHVYRKTE